MYFQLQPTRKFFNHGGLTFPEEEDDLQMDGMHGSNGGIANPAFDEEESLSVDNSNHSNDEDDDVFSEPPPSYKSKETEEEPSEDLKDTTKYKIRQYLSQIQ